MPFPPINDGGNLILTNLPDQNAPLLELAGQMLAGRLVIQFNFLMTSNAANPAISQAAQSYGSLLAFQVNNWFAAIVGTDGSAYGGTQLAVPKVGHDRSCRFFSCFWGFLGINR